MGAPAAVAPPCRIGDTATADRHDRGKNPWSTARPEPPRVIPADVHATSAKSLATSRPRRQTLRAFGTPATASGTSAAATQTKSAGAPTAIP